MAHTTPTIERTDGRVRVDLTHAVAMSPRQAADLRVALLLLRAAGLPDHVFAGHTAANPDSVASLWDRVAIVATMDDITGLPELP